MRTATVIASAILHALVALLLLHTAKVRARHAPTAISVLSSKEKPGPPKPVAKARPPRPQPTKVQTAAAPARTGPTATAPAPTHAPIDTGLKMGNVEEPGIDIGGAPPRPRELAALEPEKPKLLARARKQQAAPTERTGTTEDCSEEPTKPVVLARPSDIEYTEKARAAGIEGRLVLQVIVAADGSVVDVKVIKSVDPALDAAAIAAVQTWRFKPAMQCGQPVAGGVYTIAQRFELGD